MNTSKPLPPSWGDIRYLWFCCRHKNWAPPTTHNTYPHKPHWLVLIWDERKSRRVVSEKRNCTNPLGSAVHAGYSRKESFTRFYLSLPSFLLQVIIGTPPAPTMPGGLLLVDSQTTGSASHPPCSTSLSFSFSPTHPVFYSPVALSPSKTGHIPSSNNYSLLKNCFFFPTLRISDFLYTLYKCYKITLILHITFRFYVSVYV